jgi:hypothetical protein
MINVKQIVEILDRGNTAEIKKTKDGIVLLEVKRKIQQRGMEDEELTATES